MPLKKFEIVPAGTGSHIINIRDSVLRCLALTGTKGQVSITQRNNDILIGLDSTYASGLGNMFKSENLSGLLDYTVARTNLGLGTLATQNGSFSGTSSGINTGDQDLSGYALTNQTFYLGTTLVAINRGSGAIVLTGITSIDGNAATVTNGVYTSGSYANPTWITSLAYSKITGAPSTIAWSSVTGTPTTVAGYGIIDVYTQTASDTRYLQLTGGTLSGLLKADGGIDVTATGGSDVLNIGTTNADVINIGNSATVLNLLGTAIFEYQANQYVTDKLVTLNYGGAAASGVGVGYEVQENSVITGYFKTNGTRTGYSLLAPANAGILNLITIGTNVTLTAGNTGTIAVTSDITTALSGAYALIGQTMYIGTTSVAINRASAALVLTGITSIDGLAATATALATGRTINGITFDGTANITITAAASTLTGTTLNTTIITSSLTAVGTIGTGVWNGTKVSEAYGGTNQSTYTLGDILYSSAANTLSKLAGNVTSTRNFLRQTGTGTVSAAPVWDTVTKTDVGLSNVENTALSSWAGTSNITTLGTIVTGVWNGTLIDPTYGGTGVNNGAKTITLGGNLITSGAFNLTLSVPRTTTYSLPNTASETLAGLGTAQTFTVNQTLQAHLYPQATNTYDLGQNASTGDWRQVYSRILGTADGSGTDIAGTSLFIKAGKGTGAGTISNITFQTPTILSTGSTLQSLTTRVTIDSSGLTINSGQALAPDGTTSLPSYGFSSESGVGMRRSASSTIQFVTGNTSRMLIGSSAISLLTTTVSLVDGAIITSGSSTGIKVLNNITHKLGFWNATPIAQPANTVAIDDVLINTGLWASGATTAKFTKAISGATVGVTDASSASAGNVGEEIISTVSTYTNYTTTATYQNITSISLTAGDWEITIVGTISTNSATLTTTANSIFVCSTTTASAAGSTEGLNIVYIDQNLLGTSKQSISFSFKQTISSTTVYYLNSQATFTLGNPQFVGTIRARRER